MDLIFDLVDNASGQLPGSAAFRSNEAFVIDRSGVRYYANFMEHKIKRSCLSLYVSSQSRKECIIYNVKC